ncbi:MAG: PD40 domain-containing protein, partial [Candidatus Krumholzibacteria bacterium]|nr:PD40 domain-containing protein [Candidatus Krumholzibacteria bacterium]
YEITIRPQDGSGDERQLTADSGEWILQPVWSPDSKKMAFSDKMNRLWALDVESGAKTLVDRSSYAGVGSYEFSPDSKWICYTKESKNLKTIICAYSLDDKKVLRLTDGGADDREPTFSKDGKYLFFVSSRDFDYKYREFRSRLYVATLSKETPSPLAPLSDEEKPEPEEKPKEGKKNEDDKSVVVVEIERIDAEGFPGRVVVLPEEQGRYYGLTAVEGGFVYLTGDNELKRYDLEKRKSEKILEKVNNYQVAAKGKKFIYQSGSDYGIAGLEPGQKAGAGKLDLGRMELRIDPQAEWRQIYFDAWRIMRDWFYDPGMHKVDWERMRERYAVLLPHLAHRA